MKKLILAYSGGLDTSCCIKWLKDRGFDVICFSANLGSEFSPSDLKRRAIKSGASKIYIKDLKVEFARQYILKALQANAIYEGKYLLSTALGRPLIAKYLVEVANHEKAQFVAHGCTGKGNDQVRIELSVGILNHRLNIIAPLREWEFNSRQEEIEYAQKYKIPIKTENKLYSIDKNIWGISIEGGVLENLEEIPPQDSYHFTLPLRAAKDKAVYVEIEFIKGVPVKLNGKKLSLVKIIEALNRTGAAHGIGRTDLIEDRVIGIKSRETYEAPGAWILYTSHKELENLTVDRETLFFKEMVSFKYAQLIYQGLWFTELKNALDAFVERTQKCVTGVIGLELYKGNITIVKRKSVNSLYKKEIATYGEKSTFNRESAKGFIELWGMPFKRNVEVNYGRKTLGRKIQEKD